MLKRSLLAAGMIAAMAGACVAPMSFAEEAGDYRPVRGEVKPRTIGAGLLSLLIWPGIGQAVNDAPGDKVATHAVIGLLPPYRLWSGYDALFDRKGGYWKGRI